jgi:hypothetical protein
MRVPVRAAGAAAIGLVYASFAFACPEWTRDLGLDVWNYSTLNEQVETHRQRESELDKVSERVRKRLELKQLIVDAVIEEQLTLEMASDQFLALNRIPPDNMPAGRFQFPGASDEEIAARQVIALVKATLNSNPSRGAEVLCRLEAQWQAAFDRTRGD